MAEKTIKHAQFSYQVENTDTDTRTGKERQRLSKRVALRGATVDIPRDEDIQRGEEQDAFVTEEDVATTEEVSEEEEEEAEPSPESDEIYDDLVRWIRDTKPTADKVVAEAGNDPEKARMLMDAEEEASGGQPRKGVMAELEKIANA